MSSFNDKTIESVLLHKARVKKWATKFTHLLLARAELHDDSKLKEPELTGWRMMDSEPWYRYGTPDYFDKVRRYHWLMELHWGQNRHHPEYWDLHPEWQDKDLLDICEMMIDWLSYKDVISVSEAIELVDKQTKRYNFSEELSDLMKNTLLNYFSTMGGVYVHEENKEQKENDRIDLGEMFSSYA